MRTFTRSLLCLALAFVLGFLCIIPASATTREITLFPERELQPGDMFEYTVSIAGDGTDLWILRGQHDARLLYRWSSGEAEPAPCGEAINANAESLDFLALVNGEGTALMLDTLSGAVGELTGDGVAWREAPLALPEGFRPDLDIPDVWQPRAFAAASLQQKLPAAVSGFFSANNCRSDSVKYFSVKLLAAQAFITRSISIISVPIPIIIKCTIR